LSNREGVEIIGRIGPRQYCRTIREIAGRENRRDLAGDVGLNGLADGVGAVERSGGRADEDNR
jgi:hypothetical protein